MQTRSIGPFTVSAIGYGAMNLSHGYGTPPDKATGIRVLNEALDLGHTHLDTAALYGFGANEELLGEAVSHRRGTFMLASKCGLGKGPDGQRGVDGRPDTIRYTCETSLKSLRTDVIDLYYLHRMDKNVPIEESIGALAELVAEGKIRTIGLSEVDTATLRKAHAVHPITALQTEYSLWTRNAEIAVLQACKELGIAFVAFSPLARGYLTGRLTDPSALPDKDIRRTMPRFSAENYPKNLVLLAGVKAIAEELSCSMAQLALAWVLAKGDHIIPIPGTTKIDHLRENIGAAEVTVPDDAMTRLDKLINQNTVHGLRYNAAAQADVYTEDFA
ncbi:aldo/keto reductase [Magnetospira sp. QH-2]|uniref:aldo/keto reductase n=1 Tax=Magnetospira sp. (strain QH-2) TaxID=1288970 RepID=UPI0003E81C2B|nr:aldo/keto reductase [Magnetospira sp. QH-2]CCQ74524.1 Aldo-keto reductase [NADP+] [Magnetospira sp. QH-2]